MNEKVKEPSAAIREKKKGWGVAGGGISLD